MRAHTPGPWQVVEEAALDYRPCTIFGAEGGSQVAMLCGGGRKRAIDKGEERANARLIAAAPELLAIIFKAINLYDRELLHLLPSKDTQAFLVAARAAIAKAEGRP